MSDKDFLSQFSGSEGKPDSFKEEERVQVVKEKKPFNPLFVIIPLVVLLIAGFLVWFFGFRPSITVVDFTGLSKDDAVAWINQQGIETSGVLFKEEYNFDVDKDLIISQDPATGKVNKKAKFNFVVSKGADPDEAVDVPDLSSMTKTNIEAWIKTNKLSNTKISTAYSSDVEEGKLIKAEYSGCDEESFTRGCSLKISISKGAKPASQVTMENFVGKTYSDFETWCTQKGLKASKTEEYSSTVASGTIISQAVAAKALVDVGSTVNVVVSKGKAVIMEDFVGKTVSDVNVWASKHSVSIDTTNYQYYNNSAAGTIIAQSPTAGYVVSDVAVFTVSLGNPDISEAKATTLQELKTWINEVNAKGANLSIGTVKYTKDDKVEAGTIISMPSSVTVGQSIDVTVSEGKNIWLVAFENGDTWQNIISQITTEPYVATYNEDTIRGYLADNVYKDLPITWKISYAKSSIVPAHYLISIKRSDKKELTTESYISQSVVIEIVISEGA